jgi:hypothetical protein
MDVRDLPATVGGFAWPRFVRRLVARGMLLTDDTIAATAAAACCDVRRALRNSYQRRSISIRLMYLHPDYLLGASE